MSSKLLQADCLCSPSDNDNIHLIASERQPITKCNKPFGQYIRELVADYAIDSTVHGVRYVFEKRRHWSERLLWVIAFVASVFGCGREILNVYARWDQYPVIVTFAEHTTPVWKIPFPAVTICPETRAISGILNYTRVFHRINEDKSVTDAEHRQLMAMLHVCFNNKLNKTGREEFASQMYKTIQEIAPTFGSNVFNCSINNNFHRCSDIFEPVMTDEGLCYTFNMVGSKKLFRDTVSLDFLLDNHPLTNDSTRPAPKESVSKPFRVFGAGKRAGLFMMMSLDTHDIDHLCQNVQGHQMLMHAPDETPQMTNNFYQISRDMNVLVAIKPNVLTTSERLRNYAPHRRQCYFESERHLQFYRIYKQRNCQLECLTNYTLKTCGCVKFSMPHNKSTPVCGASRIKCYSEAEDELQRLEFAQSVGGRSVAAGCNCLPDCTSITYDAELTQTVLSWPDIHNARQQAFDTTVSKHTSGLSIFFKEKQFIASHRSELYGRTDFLANCGGLIGLFMGMSILSIVEMMYYCTLRLACKLMAQKNEERSDASTDGNTGINCVDMGEVEALVLD